MHGAFLCCYYRFSIGNLVPLFLAFLHLIIKIILIIIIVTRTRRRIERTIVLPISGDLPQPSGEDLGSFCSGGGGGGGGGSWDSLYSRMKPIISILPRR